LELLLLHLDSLRPLFFWVLYFFWFDLAMYVFFFSLLSFCSNFLWSLSFCSFNTDLHASWKFRFSTLLTWSLLWSGLWYFESFIINKKFLWGLALRIWGFQLKQLSWGIDISKEELTFWSKMQLLKAFSRSVIKAILCKQNLVAS